MPFLVTYIIKFSISLAVVYLFYQLVLRRLTFYNWNRVYLFGYVMICFFIPFIDISGALKQNKLAESEMMNWLPFFQLKNTIASQDAGISILNIISMMIVAGIIFMTIRLIVQFFSFRKLLKNATLISNNGIYLYQVDKEIIPFSFGNAVFINIIFLHARDEQFPYGIAIHLAHRVAARLPAVKVAHHADGYSMGCPHAEHHTCFTGTRFHVCAKVAVCFTVIALFEQIHRQVRCIALDLLLGRFHRLLLPVQMHKAHL